MENSTGSAADQRRRARRHAAKSHGLVRAVLVLLLHVGCGGATRDGSSGSLTGGATSTDGSAGSAGAADAASDGTKNVSGTGGNGTSGGAAAGMWTSGGSSAGGDGGGGRSNAGASSARTGGGMCQGDGDGCANDSECCSGYCTSYRFAADGAPLEQLLCQRPGCSHVGEPCKTISDCCVVSYAFCSEVAGTCGQDHGR